MKKPTTTRKPPAGKSPRPRRTAIAPTIESCLELAQGYLSTLEDGADDAHFVLSHALAGIANSLASLSGVPVDVESTYLRVTPPKAGASKPATMVYSLKILALGHRVGLAVASTLIARINKLVREDLELRGLSVA